jgi:hypothetical protein
LIFWLLVAGVVVVVVGFLLGVVGRRWEAGAAGEAGVRVATAEPSGPAKDPPPTQLQEAGAILLRVGLLVALVGLVGWDLLEFLMSLARGFLTRG